MIDDGECDDHLEQRHDHGRSDLDALDVGRDVASASERDHAHADHSDRHADTGGAVGDGGEGGDREVVDGDVRGDRTLDLSAHGHARRANEGSCTRHQRHCSAHTQTHAPTLVRQADDAARTEWPSNPLPVALHHASAADPARGAPDRSNRCASRAQHRTLVERDGESRCSGAHGSAARHHGEGAESGRHLGVGERAEKRRKKADAEQTDVGTVGGEGEWWLDVHLLLVAACVAPLSLLLPLFSSDRSG